MTITLRAVGTADSAVTGDVIPGLPAGHALNDILLLHVESWADDVAPAAPAGYAIAGVSVISGTGATSHTRCTVFWKRHDGSESDPTVVGPGTPATGSHTIAIISAWTGVKTSGEPWDPTPVTSFDANSLVVFSVTGVTTTVDNCMIVALACAGDNVTFADWANSNLTSITEAYDALTIEGNDGAVGCGYGILVAAGATGATTGNTSASERDANIMIALEPITATIIAQAAHHYKLMQGN